MARRKLVRLPQMLWYGNGELEIDFPEGWDIAVCKMHGHDAPSLNDIGIRKAFNNPIGKNHKGVGPREKGGGNTL